MLIYRYLIIILVAIQSAGIDLRSVSPNSRSPGPTKNSSAGHKFSPNTSKTNKKSQILPPIKRATGNTGNAQQKPLQNAQSAKNMHTGQTIQNTQTVPNAQSNSNMQNTQNKRDVSPQQNSQSPEKRGKGLF